MTDMFTAAAMHGIATNEAMPIADRLGAALQALDAYEKRIEELQDEEIEGIEETTELPADTEPHLTPTITDRGFKRMPPISGMKVYESSNAMHPHIWLDAGCECAATELTVDDALSLAEQIEWLVRNHYQLVEEG